METATDIIIRIWGRHAIYLQFLIRRPTIQAFSEVALTFMSLNKLNDLICYYHSNAPVLQKLRILTKSTFITWILARVSVCSVEIVLLCLLESH